LSQQNQSIDKPGEEKNTFKIHFDNVVLHW